MGPLKGIRIIEIAGLGPGPFAGMLLADMGAEIIRVDRPGGGMFAGANPDFDYLNRGKRSIAVNLKTPEGVETVLKLAESADAMFEGFRPGVVEKLGIGPEVVRALRARGLGVDRVTQRAGDDQSSRRLQSTARTQHRKAQSARGGFLRPEIERRAEVRGSRAARAVAHRGYHRGD